MKNRKGRERETKQCNKCLLTSLLCPAASMMNGDDGGEGEGEREREGKK